MKHILRIAIKDFRIQLKSILMYMVIGLVMVTVFSLINLTDKQMTYAIAAFAIIYGFVNKALYEDERNNTLRLLASMPIKRDVIVYARYLSTGVYSIALCLVMVFITLLSGLILHPDYDPEAVIILAGTFMVFAVMLSIYLPLAFKLGYIKAAGINRFVLLGLFAFFGAITAVLAAVLKGKESDIPQKLNSLNDTLSSMDPISVFACIILFVLLIYLGSLVISIRLFRKRVLF